MFKHELVWSDFVHSASPRFALLCDSDFSNESESYNLIPIQLLKLSLGEQHGASLIQNFLGCFFP